MSGQTPRSLPLHWAVTLEASKFWARLAKGRGRDGFCLWPVVPLSRSGPLPFEDLHGCFESTLAGCSRKPRTLLLSLGEKRFVVVLSQGPWP